jgi:indole-3-glycerol phosphate synthase
MFLEQIVAQTRRRVHQAKENLPLAELRRRVEFHSGAAAVHTSGAAFATALRPDGAAARGMNFICEVKKASPSKGLIAAAFPYLQIAREYAAAGAAAISVLTEPDFFRGADAYLEEISHAVTVPLLRKDFVIDEYQIYQAPPLGAAAVLLIVALLDLPQLRDFLALTTQLGLAALVETHTEKEVEIALAADAAILGVNNRNLQTFAVDLQTTPRLRRRIPASKIVVAESGIQTVADLQCLAACGVDAVLVGETLMRETDKTARLQEWRQATRRTP